MKTEKKQQKNIGIEVKYPTRECDDINCPFHGRLKIRGREFLGEIKRIGSQRTVVVEWLRFYYLPKYERYEKRFSRVSAHAPPCMDLKIGNHVRIVECRPLSKTKNFVVVEVIK